MWKYQYRKENEAGGFRKVETKDFKRLNKKVLQEGATNAAVSTDDATAMKRLSDFKLLVIRLTVLSAPTMTSNCSKSQPALVLLLATAESLPSTQARKLPTAGPTVHRRPSLASSTRSTVPTKRCSQLRGTPRGSSRKPLIKAPWASG